MTAFVVAVTSFSFLGITSAFWAIVAGSAASLLVERNDLGDYPLKTRIPA
jgi:predicted benzoate:H+ symporter BenE